MNAIPDKFAQWDVAYVLRRAVSCRAPGVRGASGQLSHLPVGRLGTYCPSRVCWLRARQRMRRCCLGGRRGGIPRRLIAQRIVHAGFKRSGHGRTWQEIRRLSERRPLVIAENGNPTSPGSPAASTETVARLLAGQAHLRANWLTA
jgi:hypothetical protein